jgi:DNA-binding transcriptional LysR family regulator
VEVTEGTASEVVMQLRSGRIDVAFVFGIPELPDCHSRQAWTEPLLAALPAKHRLAEQTGVTWADLATETFLVRHGGTGPQVHDHIVLRLAGHWPAPSILRLGIERSSLLSMVGQGFGITVVGTATSRLSGPDVVFRPIIDELEPAAFSAAWSPYNRSTALQNLLSLANEMGRSIQPTEKVQRKYLI